MDHNPRQERINALFQLIASLDNVDDCRALFEDMCTIKEVTNMAERCFAAKLLM